MPVSRSATATMSAPLASRASAIARSTTARPARPSCSSSGAAAAAAVHSASTSWVVVVGPTTSAMLPVRGSMLTTSGTVSFLPSCELLVVLDGGKHGEFLDELQPGLDQLAQLAQ